MSFALVWRNFDAKPPRLSNLPERVRTLGRSPVVPYIEAINAGQNAISNFVGGDAGGLGPASELLEQAPALSPEADARRQELRALVARARDTAGDKSLKPEEREGRLRQLAADLNGWQERFAQWVEAEGEEFGIGMQKADAPDEGKK